MLSKINICNILKGHIRTLRNEGASRMERKPVAQRSDICLFFVLPVPVAAAGYFLTNPLEGFALTITATAFAIMAGLLLNLLMLVYQIMATTHSNSMNTGEDSRTIQNRNGLLIDTYHNISFLIILGIVSIAFLVLIAILHEDHYMFSKILTSMVYYTSIVFMLTLIMVIKRIHVLLGTIQQPKEQEQPQ